MALLNRAKWMEKNLHIATGKRYGVKAKRLI